MHLNYDHPPHMQTSRPGAASTTLLCGTPPFMGRSPVLAWQIPRTSMSDSPYLVGSIAVVGWYSLRTRLEPTPYLLGKYPVPRWHQIAFIYRVIKRLQKTNVL